MILSTLLFLFQQAPVEKVGLIFSDVAATPGYVLIAPLKSKTTFLINKANGRIAHKWESEYLPGNSVYLLDSGELWRTTAPGDNKVFHGGGAGGGVQLLAWDGTVTWELDWSDKTRLSHHDIEPLPNGNLLLISWEYKSPEQAFDAGRHPDEISENGFWPDYVVEVKPLFEGGKGEMERVWEWHAWDHLVQDRAESKANFGVVADSPELFDINGDVGVKSEAQLRREAELESDMEGLGYIGGGDDDAPKSTDIDQLKRRKKGGDWLHTNGIDYDPVRDLIVLSSRVLSEVWIIDHSTTTEQAASSTGGNFGKGGDILWRWGNPQKYGAGGPEDQDLFKQHDPTFLPEGTPGAGNLLIYNNGEGRPEGGFSTVIEIKLPLNDEGDAFPRFSDAFGPTNLEWKVGAPKGSGELSFFSSFISGAQRLQSGNTLICVGSTGNVLEVTSEGELVWEYVCPFRDLSKRPSGKGDKPRRSPGGRPPGRGPGPDLKNALFRATHFDAAHPGLSRLSGAKSND